MYIKPCPEKIRAARRKQGLSAYALAMKAGLDKKDDGIGEGQYAACLDFLALEGYILLRTVKDHVRCEDLADHNWTELEAKLSGKGMRVLEKDVKDAMIEV